MNRIDRLFQTKEREILSVYFTAGYPQLNDTLPTLCELQRGGVDMVEIGIPFSDPMADGPVIQASSSVALQNGMSLKLLFTQLAEVRQEVKIPLILMGYLNPIMQFGFEPFCAACAKVGIDGVIIPDLPFKDYMESYKEVAQKHGVKVIMLITPETSDERIKWIDQETEGFIYMVSSAATTGAQQSFDEAKVAYFKHVESLELRLPRLVGFGISNRESYLSACNHSSGAIIGSKFIELLGCKPSIAEAVTALLQAIGRQ